jgi:hypothetical protein
LTSIQEELEKSKVKTSPMPTGREKEMIEEEEEE